MRSSVGRSGGPAPGVVLAALAALAALAVLAGACSGPAGTRRSAPAASHEPVGASSTSTTLHAADAAVIDAWTAAENTLYGYLQQPWQQARAALTSGKTAGDLWPQLPDYFASPALGSEVDFLIQVKMAELNGPTSYDLGHPSVAHLAANSATVQGCIYDTGTTTVTGAPGPVTLDGGGRGGYAGTWNLQRGKSGWRISSFKTTSVSKC